MTNWDKFSTKFRDRLKEEAPEHIFNLWFERDEDGLIRDKYKFNEWQIKAFNDIQRDIFLKDIPLITLVKEIKNGLKIKDEKIAKSIALDTAIHTFSKAKDYFKDTDNLIKSLGGEEAYWKKYSSDYWNEIVVAEPLIAADDIKNAYYIAEKEVLKAEVALKELGESNVRDVIPKTYPQILSNFNEVKTKLDSENYDLILESKELATRVINDVYKAKNKAMSIQKVAPRKIELEKEIERRKAACIKERASLKFYNIAHYVGLICFILAILYFSGFFYLLFAIISGITRQFIDCLQEKEEAFFFKVISFVFGFVLAPLYLLRFFEDIRIRKNYVCSRFQTDELMKQLNEINRQLE